MANQYHRAPKLLSFCLTVYDRSSWTLGLRLRYSPGWLAGIVGLEGISIEGIEIMGVAEIAQGDCVG